MRFTQSKRSYATPTDSRVGIEGVVGPCWLGEAASRTHLANRPRCDASDWEYRAPGVFEHMVAANDVDRRRQKERLGHHEQTLEALPKLTSCS